MRIRKKLLFALFLLGAFAVMVVADGTTQAKEKQLTAYQKDSENTETKLKGALTLTSKAKVKEEKKAPKKPVAAKAKPAAKPTPSPSQKYPKLDARSAKYVVDCDRRIQVYTEAAEKARETGDEDLAQLYIAAAAKERLKRAAILKEEPGKEENQAIQDATKKESEVFNRIVKNTDRDQLTAEDKTYLRNQVISPLERSTIFFQQFIDNALKPLLNQFLGSPQAIMNTASTIHTIASGGCATPSAAVNTGMVVASFVIPLVRSLVDLVQFYVADTQQTVTNLNYLVN